MEKRATHKSRPLASPQANCSLLQLGERKRKTTAVPSVSLDSSERSFSAVCSVSVYFSTRLRGTCPCFCSDAWFRCCPANSVLTLIEVVTMGGKTLYKGGRAIAKRILYYVTVSGTNVNADIITAVVVPSQLLGNVPCTHES